MSHSPSHFLVDLVHTREGGAHGWAQCSSPRFKSSCNVLLSTLIDVSRRVIRPHEFWLVGPLAQFDIRRTLPGLPHDFMLSPVLYFCL